jgi:hypothetical protein
MADVDVDNEDVVCVTPAGKQQLLFRKFEKVMKEFKAHRCVLDFDHGFVHSALKGTYESK